MGRGVDWACLRWGAHLPFGNIHRLREHLFGVQLPIMSSNGNYNGDEKWADALSRGLKALEEVGIDGWLVESGNRRLLLSTTAPPSMSERDLSTLPSPGPSVSSNNSKRQYLFPLVDILVIAKVFCKGFPPSPLYVPNIYPTNPAISIRGR